MPSFFGIQLKLSVLSNLTTFCFGVRRPVSSRPQWLLAQIQALKLTLEWIEDEVEDYQDDDDEEDDVIQHLTPEELDDMVQNLNNSESEDLSYKPLVSVVNSSLTILSRPSPKSRVSAPW